MVPDMATMLFLSFDLYNYYLSISRIIYSTFLKTIKEKIIMIFSYNLTTMLRNGIKIIDCQKHTGCNLALKE